MYLLGVEIELLIPAAYSLKDKRKTVRSIIDRLQHRYKYTAAEVGQQEVYNLASLGVGLVTNDYALAKNRLLKTLDWIEEIYPVEIVTVDWYEAG